MERDPGSCRALARRGAGAGSPRSSPGGSPVGVGPSGGSVPDGCSVRPRHAVRGPAYVRFSGRPVSNWPARWTIRGMSQQGERRPVTRDDWWSQLYDDTADDTGPTAAGDSVDDRFASAAGTVELRGPGREPGLGRVRVPIRFRVRARLPVRVLLRVPVPGWIRVRVRWVKAHVPGRVWARWARQRVRRDRVFRHRVRRATPGELPLTRLPSLPCSRPSPRPNRARMLRPRRPGRTARWTPSPTPRRGTSAAAWSARTVSLPPATRRCPRTPHSRPAAPPPCPPASPVRPAPLPAASSSRTLTDNPASDQRDLRPGSPSPLGPYPQPPALPSADPAPQLLPAAPPQPPLTLDYVGSGPPPTTPSPPRSPGRPGRTRRPRRRHRVGRGAVRGEHDSGRFRAGDSARFRGSRGGTRC